MKAVLIATLLVFSAAAVAGGDNLRRGAPEDTWLGESNTDHIARTLTVRCPEGTLADSIEAIPDEEGVVLVIDCNYNN